MKNILLIICIICIVNCKKNTIGDGVIPPQFIGFFIDSSINIKNVVIKLFPCSDCVQWHVWGNNVASIYANINQQGVIEIIKNGKLIKDSIFIQTNSNTPVATFQNIKINNIIINFPYKRYDADSLLYTIKPLN